MGSTRGTSPLPRPGWLPLALAALLIGAACSGGAAPVAAPVAAPPEAASVSTRLTFYQAAAQIANSRYQIVEDPSCAAGGPECLTDPQTGKHYRRTDRGFDAQDIPTPTGDGYSQVDVVGHDGNIAILDINVFTIDRTFNQLFWTPVGRSRVDAAVADGLWIHPAELARLEREGIPGVLMARGPYTIGDTTYDTLAFWSEVGRGRYSYTYDTASGLLVAANTSTQGATSPLRIRGEDPPQANSQFTMTRLLEVRQRSVPGLGGTLPGWATTGRQLRYSGTRNFINPIDPSTANLNHPAEHLVTIGQTGPGWVQHSARTLVPGIGMDQVLEGVSGGTGLYWYDTAALAGLSAGQQLDSDPVTGESVSVGTIAPGPDGVNLITINSQMPGVTTRAVYRADNGLLVAYDAQLASIGATLSLQLAEMR